jgi:hypothetical protein
MAAVFGTGSRNIILPLYRSHTTTGRESKLDHSLIDHGAVIRRRKSFD